MYSHQVHGVINQIMELFYRLGLWHHGDEATVKETTTKLFYFIFYLLFPISLIAGAITSNNAGEPIFLLQAAVMFIVLAMKLFYIIWKKEQIIELLCQIDVFSFEDHIEYTLVSQKLKSFMKFVIVFFVNVCFGCGCAVVVVPFVGSEKKLFYNIAFPFDYKNNEIAFCLAFAFVFLEVIITMISILFSIIIWYLMFTASLMYNTLGIELKNIGAIRTVQETENNGKQNTFFGDLIKLIESHQRIKT